MRRYWLFLPILAISINLISPHTTSAGTGKAKQVDPETGLKIAPGWDLVKTNCTVCHSAKFVTAQQGSRETWLEMIRWMQKTQGLWQFDQSTENAILDYLANNYPPGKPSRRPNLPASAMPAAE